MIHIQHVQVGPKQMVVQIKLCLKWEFFRIFS